MITSLSGRTVFARIQARSGSATACHSATSAATSRSRRACDLPRRPLRVVVVGLVAGDDVGAQPDHVREQVAHRPVRAGGHAQLRPLRRQVGDQVDHALLGRLHSSIASTRTPNHPRAPPRSGRAVPRRSGGCARRQRGGSESRESALTADAGPEPLTCVPGSGSGLHPRGAGAERVDSGVRAGPSGPGRAARDRGEQELGDVEDLHARCPAASLCRWVRPSESMTRQNGQPVAIFVRAGAQRLVDALQVDPLADLLLHPHPRAAGAAAERAVGVPRHLRQPRAGGADQRARLGVDLVVPAQVARVVVGDVRGSPSGAATGTSRPSRTSVLSSWVWCTTS